MAFSERGWEVGGGGNKTTKLVLKMSLPKINGVIVVTIVTSIV